MANYPKFKPISAGRIRGYDSRIARNAQNNASALYNGMVHPFARMSVRGILWYQGEANADESVPLFLIWLAILSSAALAAFNFYRVASKCD